MLFATTNLGKVKEVEDILKTKVLSLKDLNEKIEVDENGKTFLENAIIKAKTIYEKTKIPTLAEDSGLEIEVLNILSLFLCMLNTVSSSDTPNLLA